MRARIAGSGLYRSIPTRIARRVGAAALCPVMLCAVRGAARNAARIAHWPLAVIPGLRVDDNISGNYLGGLDECESPRSLIGRARCFFRRQLRRNPGGAGADPDTGG